MRTVAALALLLAVGIATVEAKKPMHNPVHAIKNPLRDSWCKKMNCSAQGEVCGHTSDTMTTECWSPYTCITDGASIGVCQPHRSLGQRCMVSEDCRDNSVIPDGMYCKNGVCAEYAKEGEACFDGQCEDDLVCDYSSHVCKNIFTAKLGESCGDLECIKTLQCVDGTCVNFKKIGEQCDAMSCVIDATCVDGICIPWFSGKEGQRCYDGLSFACEDGLICSQKGYCTKPTRSDGNECYGKLCSDTNYCKCNYDDGKDYCTAMEPTTLVERQIFKDAIKCFNSNGYDVNKCKKEIAEMYLSIPELGPVDANICSTQ